MQTKPIAKTDGKYRWQYKMSLFKNPTVFLSTAKALLIALAITIAILALISLISDGFKAESFGLVGKIALLMLAIFAGLLILGYLLYAAIMGGSLVMNFEMDEQKLIASQEAKQAKKAKAIGIAAAIAGLFAKNRGAVSAGVGAAARSADVTEFGSVRKVVVNKARGVIRLRSIGSSEVYADGADFDFVADWIRARIPDTAKWVVKG